MYGSNVEDRYRYDATFRRVVDLMRAHLSVYEITPSELRQAAILAATMHESQRVKPLFTRSYFPAKPWGGMEVFIDEAKDIPPAVFGGNTNTPTTMGAYLVNSKVPEHCHIFRSSGYGYDVCNDCGMSDVYYNWAYKSKS